MSCDRITWPDFSELRVLELMIEGKCSELNLMKLNAPKRPLPEWKLKTLLSCCISLESLTVLCSNSLVDEDCVAIGYHITSTNSLKKLCLSLGESLYRFVGMSGKGVAAITAALASNQSLPLERLELECGCTFTATAGDSLAQFITHTTTLKYLSIKRYAFSAHALLVLARAMRYNSILQTKHVDKFRLTVCGDNEAKDLAHLLVEHPDLINRMNSQMNDKYILCSGISDAGAEALAQALHHNSTLTGLNLSNNSIGDAGAVTLAQALHHNSTLTRLYLSNNSISDAGAVALAQALYHNSTLTELDLTGNNGIGEEGTRQLVQALTVNTSIVEWYGGLSLPMRCEEYATKCQQYSTLKDRIAFH